MLHVQHKACSNLQHAHVKLCLVHLACDYVTYLKVGICMTNMQHKACSDLQHAHVEVVSWPLGMPPCHLLDELVLA